MNIEKLTGFICGVGVAVLLVWAISRRFNTDGSRKTKYDERQREIRGEGFKFALYSLYIYLGLIIAIDCLGVVLPVSSTVISFTGIAISGFILSGYCILHDAYWGINNNTKVITRFLIGVGGINLVFGIIEAVKGTLIVGGVLQNTFINFEAGILIVGIGVMLLVKRGQENREECVIEDEKH